MELYFASIDELLAREQMPIEYQEFRSQIYCSDCERKSVTNFHFVYHKCQHQDCKSYNTKVLKTFKESDQHIASAHSDTMINLN
jgi:zinc finger-like protein